MELKTKHNFSRPGSNPTKMVMNALLTEFFRQNHEFWGYDTSCKEKRQEMCSPKAILWLAGTAFSSE